MRRSRFLVAAGAIWALSATAASSNPLTPSDAILLKLREDDLRLASAGFILGASNAARCVKQMPGTGLVLHSRGQYGGAWRDSALRVFGPIAELAVEAVVVASPARAAGLLPGDAVLAINARRPDTSRASGSEATAIRDQAEGVLAGLPPEAPIVLDIERGGSVRRVALAPRRSCAALFEVVAGSGRFARSDGARIQVGQWLVEHSSDAELAVVVAHELAHSILGHRAQLAALEKASRGGRRGREYAERARGFEDEADRLSVHLLAAAGFDPPAAPAFMRKFGGLEGSRHPGSVHRRPEDRARSMEAEIARMSGEPAVAP